MEEEEVVRLFLKNGYQISKNALPLVLSNPKQIILGLGKLKLRPFIVTEQHIKKILKEVKKISPKIEVLKKYELLRKPISIDDYVKHLLSRYEKIRGLISKRMGMEKLVSINKITPQTIVFSIIGIIREKGENSLLVEDPTGETHIFFDDNMKHKFEEIALDDVIGVKCKKIKDKYYAKKVIYPDVLSSRGVSRTEEDMKIVVVSNPSTLNDTKYQRLLNLLSTMTNLSSVFLFEDGINEKLLKDFSRFNPISVSQGFSSTLFRMNSIKILVLPRHFFEQFMDKMSPINFMISILKRRHVLATFDPKIHVGDNSFILDEVPDIIVSNFNESLYKNYKGTTIISISDPSKVYSVNLKTREVTENII